MFMAIAQKQGNCVKSTTFFLHENIIEMNKAHIPSDNYNMSKHSMKNRKLRREPGHKTTLCKRHNSMPGRIY